MEGHLIQLNIYLGEISDYMFKTSTMLQDRLYTLLDFPETDYCSRDRMNEGSISHHYTQDIPFPPEWDHIAFIFRLQDSKFPRLCCTDQIDSFSYGLFIGSQVEDDLTPVYDIHLRFHVIHDFADGTRIVLFNAY